MNEKAEIKKAFRISLMWVTLALSFNFGVYYFKGEKAALDFFTGYLIEKSLSVDNLFVFLLIFNHFKTPTASQHRVLFWGIFGAVAMRGVFIFFGVELVKHFHWVLYLFGGFLIWAGIQMGFFHKKEICAEENFVIKMARKAIPITSTYRNQNFFVMEQGKWFATPLFLVLLAIETSDLVFAIDSIPAIMAITLDPFIIYTSNIFAILGLRSLYFALSGLAGMFRYLHYGLAAILCFIGTKMVIEPWVKVPIELALGFIVLALVGSVVSSWERGR